MGKASGGMEKEILVEFFKEVIEGVNAMNRRQRWQFRRDLKEYCRFANVRFPFGKGEDDVPEPAKKDDAESEATGC